MRPARERPIARDIVETLGVMARTTEQPAGELSGGNQQKVSLAKWMLTRPKVLIVDEPTRGVDVGAKAEIHRLLDELARSGVAVLLISSEMTEILALADRILVVREGRLVGELSRSEATEDAILRLAAGVPATAAVAG